MKRTKIAKGILVEKNFGEKILQVLRSRNLVNKNLLIKRRNEFIIIPLVDNASLSELDISGEIVIEEFEESARASTLLEILKSKLTDDELKLVPKSFDIIGDICILQLPEGLRNKEKIIGEAFLKSMRNVRIVLKKTEPLSGEYRVGGYEVIVGEGNTETIYREHGCIFKLDISKVFFTPRLSAERIRIASLVKPGEIVCDLFAGIGPFSIIIAKKNPSVKVHACDINPDAYRYLVENIKLNKVEDRVKAYLGDARKLSQEELKGIGDRIIMNLPMSSEMFLDAACNAIKSGGGVVHLHVFLDRGVNPKDKYANIEKSLMELGYEAKMLNSRRIREVAPFKYHWGFDIEVKPR
ncbi:MAG: class I SAM-dependent methyltransferase family protein [Nitrososphaerota archaeon]|nr:class I SAM-dependent methyltransferase family protein [Nitrososphaerota archaeon]